MLDRIQTPVKNITIDLDHVKIISALERVQAGGKLVPHEQVKQEVRLIVANAKINMAKKAKMQ